MNQIFLFFIYLLAGPITFARPVIDSNRPADFVSLKAIAPKIAVDMMYHGANNFLGRPVSGYKENICLLPKIVALALERAQQKLEGTDRSLVLIVKDCYRPQKAVDDFVNWSNSAEEETKAKYYPKLQKSDLFKAGYISTFSGHSRGGSIDLTLGAYGSDGTIHELDMGTIVDFFGLESETRWSKNSPEGKKNRSLLSKVLSPDFKNYSKEWWHFTFKKEPYPNTAFNFDIAE